MSAILNKETISVHVAELVIDLVKTKPGCCIGLPTGRTPFKMYESLTKLALRNRVDFSQVRFFGLDEYLDTETQFTFKAYLEKNVYQPLKIPIENHYSPLEVTDYDLLIKEKGGLDLTLIGIGKNGHIAFNEPYTPELSWTHSIFLTESTRIANQDFFGKLEKVPIRAVTMGIQTLLASQEIVLMAFGEGKRKILEKTVEVGIDPLIPASYLSSHKNLKIFTDFEFTWLKY